MVVRDRSRSVSAVNNAAFSITAALLTLLLNFINRTVFIRVLSQEYLGLNGLFSNILSMLSLAELGVGHAINFRFTSLWRRMTPKN